MIGLCIFKSTIQRSRRNGKNRNYTAESLRPTLSPGQEGKRESLFVTVDFVHEVGSWKSERGWERDHQKQ